jgi:AbrB family looped-hinge helix DNA binding protein
MLMKIHAKGQVVIPAEVRKQMGIEVGDVLEVEVLPEEGKIELRVPAQSRSQLLEGSLKEYARGKRFPSERQMTETLRRGIARNG